MALVKDTDFEAYCEHIEREFFRLKGRSGTLSPPDFARTRTWFEAGIPLGAVLGGIAEAFASHSDGRDAGAEEVNSLAFCAPFVERAVSRRTRL